jgi:hypothetical protein
VDEAQIEVARMGVRSAASNSSWSFEEGRPKWLKATVIFGDEHWHRFAGSIGFELAPW